MLWWSRWRWRLNLVYSVLWITSFLACTAGWDRAGIAIAAMMPWSVIVLGEVALGNPGPLDELRPNGEVYSVLWITSFLSCRERWDRGGLWSIVIIAMISWSIVGLEETYSVLWIISFLSCSAGWDREGYQSRSGGSASGSCLLHCMLCSRSVPVPPFNGWYRVGYHAVLLFPQRQCHVYFIVCTVSEL